MARIMPQSGQLGGTCKPCQLLATKQKLAEVIAQWSYRIDLSELAHVLAYGSSGEIDDVKKDIAGQDYAKMGLAAQDAQARLMRALT